MNKVIFSDFTLHNSQLFKWRYMSGNEYGQSHICGGTMGSNRKSRDRKRPCPEPEVCYVHAPSGVFSPEVTSVTGSDRVRMPNRYILYYY